MQKSQTSRKFRNVLVNVWVTPQMAEALKSSAVQNQVSASEFMRNVLAKALKVKP